VFCVVEFGTATYKFVNSSKRTFDMVAFARMTFSLGFFVLFQNLVIVYRDR